VASVSLMKILLFGEFSGLHNNLKDGLLELGHEVTVAAGQDGFKKIPSDINLESDLSGVFGQLDTRIKPFLNLPRLSGFDVVQIINPFFPNAKLFPKELFYSLLKGFNKKFFVLAAGSDAYFWRYGREKLKYGPFEDILNYDLESTSYYMDSKKSFAYNKKIVGNSDGLIPVMYEYELSYSDCKKRLRTIPLPLNTDKIVYKENIIRDKLIIFHGLNRYGFKGTRHVEQAFEILTKKYPNDLECVIEGQLPLPKYLDLMAKTNVVIDQTNSHSTGMNGLFALAMGKVVLGGAEPEGLKSLELKTSPVFNVTPNKESIISKIEELLQIKSDIPKLGLEGRNFVNEVHNCKKIAQQYLDTWNLA